VKLIRNTAQSEELKISYFKGSFSSSHHHKNQKGER